MRNRGGSESDETAVVGIAEDPWLPRPRRRGHHWPVSRKTNRSPTRPSAGDADAFSAGDPSSRTDLSGLARTSRSPDGFIRREAQPIGRLIPGGAGTATARGRTQCSAPLGRDDMGLAPDQEPGSMSCQAKRRRIDYTWSWSECDFPEDHELLRDEVLCRPAGRRQADPYGRGARSEPFRPTGSRQLPLSCRPCNRDHCPAY